MPWWDKFAPTPTPVPKSDDWIYKFAPKTSAPIAPQTIPASLPVTQGALTSMQVEDAILTYNNTLSNFANGASVWTNAEEGVVIHKITAEQAAAISTRVKPSALEYELPLTYVLACLAIESTLDPLCQNANIGTNSTGVARSNPTNDPLGYDMGIAQIKLRYAPGAPDADVARAFALDVDKAIPYHCSLMATHVLQAQNIIERNTSSEPDVRLSNPLLLATGIYNFGLTGMTDYYETGQFPSHCQHVIDLEAYFAKQLGLASCFADLPKPTLP